MNKILVIHGPNLNLLGTREPEIYGSLTLEELNIRLIEFGQSLGVNLSTFQSNLEGEMINALHQAMTTASGVVINPGAYTHYFDSHSRCNYCHQPASHRSASFQCLCT
jgi:3-dehydroquinate dehydratase-2